MDTAVAAYLASLAFTAKQMCLSVCLVRVKMAEPAMITLMGTTATVLLALEGQTVKQTSMRVNRVLARIELLVATKSTDSRASVCQVTAESDARRNMTRLL